MKIPDLHTVKKIYFLGIGGIGMSALARYFQFIGKEVCGYDKTTTKLTDKLVQEGMKICFEDNHEILPSDIDLVIYTPAIPKNNAQYKYFVENEVPMIKRSAVLGLISSEYKLLAVAGTHGKTTTSCLLTHLLESSHIDCTAFLGGISENLNSNFILGKSEWMVAEADEYDRSFLTLSPYYSIITSVDADHLDIYGTEASMQESFIAFAKQVKPEGKVFIKSGLSIEKTLISDKVQIITYGIDQGQVFATNVQLKDGHFCFDYVGLDVELKDLTMALPGRHNIENAVAAISVALMTGVNSDVIQAALSSFKGIKRRFEFIKHGKTVYIDDYAHHPSELNAAIQTTRELFPDRKILGIFQPHLFSRTQDFATAFAKELDQLDEIWLMEIYPAREESIPGINSTFLLKLMESDTKFLFTRSEIFEKLKQTDASVVITLGAGDIDNTVSTIFEILKNKDNETI